MGVFDKMAEAGHEQVVFCYDRVTGMRAIIAIHDTALGPARGGTRYRSYDSEDDALDDVLRLSRGMTYKFAFTDLPRGGGKAVVLKQDGGADKRVLLRVFGRFVQLLAGRFGTGPDLGTSAAEMVDVARETDFVWALDERFGGTGDSTPITAQGVFAGIGAALAELEGAADVAGRRVAVQGLGGVGPSGRAAVRGRRNRHRRRRRHRAGQGAGQPARDRAGRPGRDLRRRLRRLQPERDRRRP
jgi:glutamate dehydrogenase/leucine dehydrogenase